jgi:hypothetical protein
MYITKHKWDCNWYWALGYVGNDNCHFHFESYLKDGKSVNDVFTECNFTYTDWWVIRDLFTQAYALKKIAEVYQYGGHQITKAGVTDIIKNSDKAKQVNEDLNLILDTVWDFMLVNNLRK